MLVPWLSLIELAIQLASAEIPYGLGSYGFRGLSGKPQRSKFAMPYADDNSAWAPGGNITG